MPVEPPAPNGATAQIVARARALERPEVLVLIASDEMALRIATAWATPGAVTVREVITADDALESLDALDRLWKHTSVDVRAVARAAGTSEAQVRRRLPLLRVNQIVYPDGTVHGLVRRLLQERVLRAFAPAGTSRKRPQG